MAVKHEAQPKNRFWDFSIAFYKQKGVEEHLLSLQKKYGFNVNLVLYFFWFSLIGEGGMSQKKVRDIMQVVAPWHNKVVLPLRRLRDSLKSSSENNPAIAQIRDEICHEELNAEKFEQLLLYEQLCMVTGRVRSPIQQVGDVCRSIASYCYLMRVKADQSLTHILDQLILVLLPQLSLEEIAKISSERLHNHPKMSKVVGTQLWLDL